MGYMSQAGHIGLKTQAAKGAYLDPGAVAPNQGVFIRTRNGSMSGDRELLIPDPEIGGNRDVPDAQFGGIAYSGEFDIYPRMESLAFLFKMAFGASTPSGAANTGYTHTSSPTDTPLPWVSLEEKVADSYEVFGYTDCKLNSLHLEADANGYLMGTLGLIGLTQATVTPTDVANQRIDTSPLLVGTNISVEWNGAALPAKSFSFDITNNIEDDDFRLGSFFLGGLVEKRRDITMGVTIRPEDHDLWRTAMWGSAGATAPGGLTHKDDVVITISSYEDIAGADPGEKYEAVITVPQAIIAPFKVEPSGDDVIEHDLEIRAVRPNPATPILTTTVKNSYATIT